VEEDGDRAPGPTFQRIQTHSNDVTSHHDQQVNSTEDEERLAKPATSAGKKACTLSEINVNPRLQSENRQLKEEKRGIVNNTGVPFRRRWQKFHAPKLHKNLADDTGEEKRLKKPE
tara:strand:- start:155 stop:502 length:348 start_codon:yes stop_codon:yes gene_type:complete